MRMTWMFLPVAAFVLAACAPIQSKKVADPQRQAGLVYQLPKRAISVAVTFVKGKPPVVAVQEGSSFGDPDPSRRYVLNLGRNQVGKTDTKIAVSSAGLLTTTSAAFTSQVSDLVQAWSKPPTQRVEAEEEPTEGEENPYQHCPEDGVVHFTAFLRDDKAGALSQGISPTGPPLELTITPGCPKLYVSLRRAWVKVEPATTKTERDHGPGFFYRVNLPYVVSVSFHTLTSQHLALLPDESETYFISLPRAVFANTTNTTKFADGVLISNDQATDSEVIAALKLPADLVRAYASAVGSVFDSFKRRDTSEAALDAQRAVNAYERVKIAACLQAIQQNPNDPTLITNCTLTVPGAPK